MRNLSDRIGIKITLLMAVGVLFYGAVIEFYNVAWGTGSWYGEFSLRWGVAFVSFVIASITALGAWGIYVWHGITNQGIIHSDNRLSVGRVLLGAFVVAVPIGLLQYSAWGIVFDGPYLRILLWAVCVAILTTLVARNQTRAWSYECILAGLLVTGSAFVTAAALTDVSAYPFSLGWSEGNRLWDYSLLFGRRLYTVQAGQEPIAYLDFGRQLIGGLPFLLPRVSILGERLWLAAVATIPYVCLGLMAFMPKEHSRSATWIFAGLLGFIFLSQGPIHAPLLICAILVAIAWRLPIWWAAPLVAIAGWFAETSRFTWMFAPAMWAIILEVGGADLVGGRLPSRTWRRVIALGASGLLGSGLAYAGVCAVSASSVDSSAATSTSQALLWYRLLPNATFGEGILLGLAKVTVPLAAVLLFASIRYWRPHVLQVLTLSVLLTAFLVVGLIISTKIGGGGDLHNLDMFLIGLLFTASVTWKAVGERFVSELRAFPFWIHAAILLMVAIPAFGPLLALRPISFADDETWVSVLADITRPRDLGSLPADHIVQASLDQLRRTVNEAKRRSPVLFMDQRQLLTFGYVQDTELIPAYEKKRMMDESLSANSAYFEPFYRDLASHRFSLIVSSLLRTPIKDSEYGFGEENNAWVRWVAKPILCYYEEKDTLDAVKVELLVPRLEAVDCSSVLPRSP